MKKKQRGQTSLEYLLMIAAIMGVMNSVLGIVRDRLVGDGRCDINSDTYLCQLNRMWSTNPGNFKFYNGNL